MHSLSQTGSAIDGQLGLYEEQADAWKAEHDRAMDCLDLESVIGFGLHIYRSIRKKDEVWSDAVRSGAIPLRKDDLDRLSKWYSSWIRPCDPLLAEIKGFEAQGYEVKDAPKFHEACLYVRSALSVSPGRIFGVAGESSADKPMSEVRDAVRRRLEAGR